MQHLASESRHQLHELFILVGASPAALAPFSFVAAASELLFIVHLGDRCGSTC